MGARQPSGGPPPQGARHGREEEGTEGAEDRADLARNRTDWAHVRTLLAKERTFSSWLRTGLAVIVGGFAAARLLGDGRGSSLVLPLGAILVAVGGVILAVGYWSYRQTLAELEAEGVRSIPSWVLIGITAVLILCAVVGVGLLL